MIARALSQEVLYNTAYEWGHNRKITGWRYERVPQAETGQLAITLASRQLRLDDSRECVRVEYSMRVPIPSFASSLSSSLSAPVPMKKTLCSSAGKVFERTDIKGLPLIGDMLITTETVLSRGRLRSISSGDIMPSFLASIMYHKLSTAVKTTWHEKTNVFVRQLCM